MLRAPTTLDFVLPALRPCDGRRKPKSKYLNSLIILISNQTLLTEVKAAAHISFVIMKI